MNIPSSDKRPIGPPSFIGEPPEWYKQSVAKEKKNMDHGIPNSSEASGHIKVPQMAIPPTKTLRDEVAMAIIAQKIAAGNRIMDDAGLRLTIVEGFEAADVFLKEREKK